MNKNSNTSKSGKIVMHRKSGRIGRTYDKDELINCKIPVYFETIEKNVYEGTATLCDTNNLIVIGFID
jgi:hypothetical protein